MYLYINDSGREDKMSCFSQLKTNQVCRIHHCQPITGLRAKARICSIDYFLPLTSYIYYKSLPFSFFLLTKTSKNVSIALIGQTKNFQLAHWLTWGHINLGHGTHIMLRTAFSVYLEPLPRWGWHNLVPTPVTLWPRICQLSTSKKKDCSLLISCLNQSTTDSLI